MHRVAWALGALWFVSSPAAAADVTKKEVKQWTKACEKRDDGAACRELAAGYQAGRGADMPASVDKTFKYAKAACTLQDGEGCQLLGDFLENRYGATMTTGNAREIANAFAGACAAGRAASCETASSFVESAKSRRMLPFDERRGVHRAACNGGHTAACGWADLLDALPGEAGASELSDEEAAGLHAALRDTAPAVRACFRKSGFDTTLTTVTVRVAASGGWAAAQVLGEAESPRSLAPCIEEAMTERDEPLFDSGARLVSFPASVQLVDETMELALPQTVAHYGDRCKGGEAEACHALDGWDAVSGAEPNPDLGGATGCEEGAARGRTVTAHIDNSRVDAVLPRDTIDAEIKRHYGQVRACYEDALKRDSGLRGQVQIRFQVAPTGVVCRAEVARNALRDQAVGQCVSRRMAELRFPATEGGKSLTVTYPFSFSPE